MSSSAAVDVFRSDDWQRETPGRADDVDDAHHEAQDEARISHAATGTGRIPPWPQRRLNEALAELGPARPDWSNAQTHRTQTDQNDDPASVYTAMPDHLPGAANDAPALESGPRTRSDLPPPPRPYLRPANGPFEPAPIEQVMFAWDEARFSDVDDAGADIVRALAFADRPPAVPAAPPPYGLTHSGNDDDERPPMIIERALAEQGLGTFAVMPETRRINPMPPIAIGFSLSVIAGAALYFAMMAV